MKRVLLLQLALFVAFPLLSQEQAVKTDERLSLVGMRLAELIERYGPPKTVYAARGNELWQDDVVFRYDKEDFFIFGDRVWQVRVASAYGVSVNDPKQAALLVLGDKAQNMGDYLLMQLSGGDWQLTLRVNFNNAGLVSAIYIYRPDY